MIKVTFEGLQETKRFLDMANKQARYAASRALNAVAFDAMREGRRHIEAGLDRPTSWTVKSWYVRKKATRANLVAAVGWSDYLQS